MKDGKPIGNALRWHEGMLLSPQHFQQLSERYEALLHYYAARATPFFWGVCHLELDEGLLDHRVFRVQNMQVILPDGLFVSDPPPHLDLSPYKVDAEKAPIRIYLCVPDASVADRQGAMARYLVTSGEAEADLDPEADEAQVAVSIPRLKPNARLVATEAGTGGFVRMPIAEVEYVDSAFRLTEYVPPHPKVIDTEWCKPVVDICQSVVRKVRGKANYLLEMIRSPVSGSNRPQFERQFNSLMAGLPTVEAYLAAGEVHPYTLYVALNQLSAHVSAVGLVDEVPRFPRYDHENIAEIFAAVAGSLFNTLDLGVQESFTEYRFDGAGHSFTMEFREEWADRKLVLGFMGQPLPEIIQWGEECYIGSESHIAIMSKNRDSGAKRERDEQHEGLRRRPGTVLFSMGEELRRVTPGETLHVYNPVKGPNEPAPSRVVLYVKHAS